MSDQQSAAERRTDHNAVLEYLKMYGPTLVKNPGMSATIGEDGSIKQTYKPVVDSQKALVNARQGSMPSYKGMDPEDVIALMGQRSKLDTQARQMPLDISQMGLQGAQTQNLLGADNRNAVDALAMLAGRAMSEQGATKRTSMQGQDAMARQSASDSAAMDRAKLMASIKQPRSEVPAASLEERKKNTSAKMFNDILGWKDPDAAKAFNSTAGYDKSKVMIVNKPGNHWWSGNELAGMDLGTADLGTIRELSAIEGISTTEMGDKIYAESVKLGVSPFEVIKALLMKAAQQQGK